MSTDTTGGRLLVSVVVAIAACSCVAVSGAPGSDAGTGNQNIHFTPHADPIHDGNGHTLKTFVAPTDPGPDGFVFSISGEVNAITGYPYPPFDPSQTWMVDGWNWQIEKYIVVVDHITLWTNPDQSSSDQSQHGPRIAHVDGPFVVDLHKGGPLSGVGGPGEEALALAALANQNDNGGAAFDPSTTYAFGFSTVPAPGDGGAINVNLDSTEEQDYELMVKNGYSVYYYGTTTWAGNQPGQAGFGLCSGNAQTNYASGNQTCAATSSLADAGAESSDAGSGSMCPNAYDFSQLPQAMNFQLGFSTPTNYVNCVNYSLSEQVGRDVRGVQTSPSQSEIEQITLHMDHPFWESFEEDTPVHWDQIAAQYIGQSPDGGLPTAHIEDFVGVPFDPFTDRNGLILPWHTCEASTLYAPPGSGSMSFSTLSVPQDPGGTCTGTVGQDFKTASCPGIRDYYDFMRYTQSTQGHLNSQGLCYIDRQYPAPAGGS